MEITALRERYAALVKEARRLGDEYKGKESEMPAETAKKIEEILGQADEVKARLETARRLVDAEAWMREPEQSPVVFHGYREAAPGEGQPAVDPQAWRSVKVAGREVRYFVPLAVQRPGYASAFEGYLRKGFTDLGPNDRKALAEGVDTAGGFLVPEDFQTRLIQKIATMAAIRNLASVVSTSRDVVSFPRINYTADDKYTSGVRFTWTGEAPASATVHRVTDPVFGRINIPVHTAMASLPVYRDLIEDAAFDVLGIAEAKLAEAFALGEDDVFLNGSGANQPLGLLADVDGDGPASVASGTAGEISTTGDPHAAYRLVKLYYSVPGQYRGQGTWLMNSNTMLEVESLVDAQGRPLIQTLVGGSVAAGEPGAIKGRPVRIDEFMPDIANDAYPIVFGDFGGYLIVDRVGLSLQRLDEVYAEQNMVVVLARRRVGGALVEPYRLKVLKAAA